MSGISKIRHHPALAIIKLHRIAEAVALHWTPAEPSDPGDVITCIVQAGFRLPTFARLLRYLTNTQRQGKVPNAESMMLALPPRAGKDRYWDLPRWEFPFPAP